MTTYPLHITDIPYSTESRLNTLDICLPRPLEESPKNAYWVVYIHGGAWRDPLIDASSFRPTLDHLFKTNNPSLAYIAGFASLNYRLSPYPQHPTHPTRLDPASTEAKLEGRSVAHPTHRNDILAALGWLRENYGVGAPSARHDSFKYVLVGHSCGATLALQVLPYLSTVSLEKPTAVAGVSGIYDIPPFAQNHVDVPVYGEILAGAFGGGPVTDELKAVWERESPVRVAKIGGLDGVSRLVLAQSRDDGLVEWEQHKLMEKAAIEVDSGYTICSEEISGHHDECWQEGREMAVVIESTVVGEARKSDSLHRLH